MLGPHFHRLDAVGAKNAVTELQRRVKLAGRGDVIWLNGFSPVHGDNAGQKIAVTRG